MVVEALATTPMIYPSSLSWEEVLSGLRAGGFSPNDGGAMIKQAGPGKGWYGYRYCPLGVIATLAGANWMFYTDEGCDDNGETQVPDMELLDSLGLMEIEIVPNLNSLYREALGFHYQKDSVQRWEVISFLHDHAGYNFNEIADEIERYGWN